MYMNSTAKTLCFEIGSERFEVPPGKACEVPRRLAYVIERRGLPLVREGAEQAENVEAVDVRLAPPRLPPGVENVAGDDEDDEDDDIGEDVDKALSAQGIPDTKKRKR